MDKQKRWLYHLGFWLVYFAVIIFNDLYLSSSFLSDPSIKWVTKAVLSQSILLIVKVCAVYYVIYYLIPRWIRSDSRIKLGLEGIVMMSFFLIVYRMLMQFVIWPLIYEEPGKIHALSMIARYLYSLLDILQVVGIASAIKLFKLRIAAIKKEKALEQEKFSSELLHLRSQVNPHFLFNSLNSIFSLSRAQSEKTPEMVLKLSNILRYMLYESEKRTSTLGNELKIIDDYIELQKMRFAEKVEVVKDINVANLNAEIAPLLILPLIENAFKHGINGADTISRIDLTITLVKDKLKIHTKNAIGVLSVVLEGQEGIGLSNIKRQLELLYRNYSLNYYKEGNYFIVDLEIELDSYAGTELFDSRG